MSVQERVYEQPSLEEEIESLVAEGRIFEAQELLKSAGDLVPAGSKLRVILAPPRFRRIDKRDVDRSAEFAWLRKNWDTYEGKWVALVGEDLVACEDSLKDLLARLAQRQFDRQPLVHHIL